MMDSLYNLSDRDMLEIASALRTGRLVIPISVLSVQRVISGETGIRVADDLRSLTARGFHAEQIATSLDLMRIDRLRRIGIDDLVDLVTTGPNVGVAGNRDTGVVVRDLFTSASETVLVAGYAVYQGQRVFQTLADRMQDVPTLKVRLFLDIQRPHTDTSTSSELIRRFAHRFKTTQWPSGRALPEVYFDPRSLDNCGTARASLHAKCIVFDNKRAFVSSANFTEAAQLRNIEVGVVLHSDTIAKRLVDFFDTMITVGHLVRVPIL